MSALPAEMGASAEMGNEVAYVAFWLGGYGFLYDATSHSLIGVRAREFSHDELASMAMQQAILNEARTDLRNMRE